MPCAYPELVSDASSSAPAGGGTGAITLTGTAPSGKRTFAAAVAVAIDLFIRTSDTSGNWEVSFARYSAANTLTRNAPIVSSNSNAFVAFAGATTVEAISPGGCQSAGLFCSWFGDGSDGDLGTLTTTLSLSRDMYYRDGTISGAGKIVTNGFKLYFCGVLDLRNAGANAIICDPGSGFAGTATGVGGSGQFTGGTLGDGGDVNAPGAGGKNAGAQAASVTFPKYANGGGSNAGGKGGTGTGGTGGASRGGAGVTSMLLRSGPDSTSLYCAIAGQPLYAIQGGASGAGGSGGGGNGTTVGAGGGGCGPGGGVLFLAAACILRGASTAAGAIACPGGAAGAGGTTTTAGCAGAGGGSGGAGGVAKVVVGCLGGTQVAGMVTANGGKGGAGGNAGTGGTGGDGGAGGDGGRVIICQVFGTTGAVTEIHTVGTVGGGAAGGAASGVTGGAGGNGGTASAAL